MPSLDLTYKSLLTVINACEGSIFEALDGLQFIFINVEECHELCRSHQFAERLCQIEKLELPAIFIYRNVGGNELAQSACIDASDALKIQKNLVLSLFQQRIHGFRQRHTASAKSEADSDFAVRVQNSDVIDTALFDANIRHWFLCLFVWNCIERTLVRLLQLETPASRCFGSGLL